jgi:hypothetical protein
VSQKLLWHRTKEPTPIQQIRPELPDGIAAIVARMMAKDPKARYQTPAQVVSELEPWAPATVALPVADEMPQLSPAATEGAGEEAAESDADAEVAVARAGAGAAVLAEAAPAPSSPFGPPAVPAASPFGSPSGASPWATRTSPFGTGSGQRPELPSPRPQAGVDTAIGPIDQTPPGTKPSPALPANPFRVDASGPAPTKLDMKKLWPWIAIGGGAILALLLAVIKVLA